MDYVGLLFSILMCLLEWKVRLLDMISWRQNQNNNRKHRNHIAKAKAGIKRHGVLELGI